MMKRIGITHHLGHVSPVFDVARSLLNVSFGDGREYDREPVTLGESDPFLRAQELKNMGIDIIVCGAISQTCHMALRSKGIEVVRSVRGRLEEVLSAFLKGTLEDAKYLMPGFEGPRRARAGRGRKRRAIANDENSDKAR